MDQVGRQKVIRRVRRAKSHFLMYPLLSQSMMVQPQRSRSQAMTMGSFKGVRYTNLIPGAAFGDRELRGAISSTGFY